ncbi:hypothetical protein IFM89_013316 [Coptis chinensis]|uniref:NusG-like N-terminal domain-containing protein n=1 Tax=Coptis chinensis TaxID=261450 RepID=A0A835LMC8_9MAGN|nr:hypothetical protein IFM89_013316 [Coptis chinensis]
MNQKLLLTTSTLPSSTPSPPSLLPLPFSSFLLFTTTTKTQNPNKLTTSATLETSSSTKVTVGGELTARERRQLRNERRESKAYNWKEEVEEKLLKKPTKRFANWKDELNLDNLADLGTQWWCVRVSRVNGHETADRLARFLARNHPIVEFKVDGFHLYLESSYDAAAPSWYWYVVGQVEELLWRPNWVMARVVFQCLVYAPAVHVKRKLKNGTISVKPKPVFPGCIFLSCVLNKELHDIIRECDGIGGFIGSKVGNTKKQINRPKPVSTEDIEAIFHQAKEEQEKADQAFDEEQRSEGILKNEEINSDAIETVVNAVGNPKPKRKTRKASKKLASSLLTGADDKLLVQGSSVRVVSGSFSEFKGSLKKLDPASGKATVGFTLFGKESFVDLDMNQIVAET